MPHGLLPTTLDEAERTDDPQAVVEAFLAAAAAGDAATATSLLADDVHYVNVGLPPIDGRDEVEKVMAMLDRPGAGFEVYLHAIAADGPVVLTERTDVLIMGKLEMQFWVWGRFEVHDGKITLWRDSFDYLDMLRSAVRGVAAIVKPSLRPSRPGRPDVPPGR